MLFNIVYVIFVISAIFYGDLILLGGFLTLRHVATIVMLLMCYRKGKRIWIDKYFNLYLCFIFFFFLSSLLTGHVGEALKYIFAFYFVCYVAYWATNIMVRKSDNLNLLVYPLLIFGVFDAIVSVSQVTGFLNLDTYISLLQIKLSESYLEKVEYGADFMGISVPGIMNHSVTNGDFLMIVSIISLYLQRKKTNLIGFIITVVLLVGSFYTQQRSPFFIAVILIAFISCKLIFKRQKLVVKLIITIPAIVLAYYGFEMFIDMVTSGSTRYVDTSWTGREEIYAKSWDFIENNPFFGGFFYFNEITKLYPHNFFFNALIYGGFFGGLALIILVFRQVFAILSKMYPLNAYIKGDILVFGCTTLAIIMNSMTHNTGIVSGSVLAWLVWGAFVGLNHKRGY